MFCLVKIIHSNVCVLIYCAQICTLDKAGVKLLHNLLKVM